MKEVGNVSLGLTGLIKLEELIAHLQKHKKQGAKFINVEHDDSHKNELYHTINLILFAEKETKESISRQVKELEMQIKTLENE
jgi:hypothetical protein